MPMMKRKNKRIKKKLMVSFSDNGFDELGLSNDLSKEGMCISSDGDLPAHQEVELSIAVPGDVFTLKGEIMWCRKTKNSNPDIPDDIGIKILEAPVEYLNYIEFIKHEKIKPGTPEF